MRHRIKKIKFKKGYDAKWAISRSLIVNFIKRGKIETTLKKAKILKSLIDRYVSKAIKNRNSDKNVLLSGIADQEAVQYLIDKVGPIFKGRIGGYVRLVKTKNRKGDNAIMTLVTWTENVPAMIEPVKKIIKKEPKKLEKLEPEVKSQKSKVKNSSQK